MRDYRELRRLCRRRFLTSAASGLGLSALLALDRLDAAATPRDKPAPAIPVKAKRCIFLFMEGAPCQFDLFSDKPRLTELDGQRPPAEVLEKARFAFIQKESATLMGTQRSFKKYGESGMSFSDLVPNLALHADRICMLQAVQTTQFNHHPAQLVMQTGNNLQGHPAIGSWLEYGLGSENENLPGYVVLNSDRVLTGGESLWGSGFMPSSNAGVLLQPTGNPVLNLQLPAGLSAAQEQRALDSIKRLNQLHEQAALDPEIESRIKAYELAFRMQKEVPSLTDLSLESEATRERYGLNRSDPAANLNPARAPASGVYAQFARHCLLARRLVEHGVRFVNVFSGSWDMHDNLNNEMPFFAGMVDQPIAALISDLADRGLLDETLVVVAAEFGRTPLGENRKGFDAVTGRDHHPDAFSLFMVGGGIKAGLTFGATDEIGWSATEGAVDVSDVHATLLHLFGFDHTKLTYRYAGLDQRLTPVTRKARVIEEILA